MRNKLSLTITMVKALKYLPLILVVFFACNPKSNNKFGKHFTNWDLNGGCQNSDTTPWGKNLAGEEFSPCDFKGSYLWVYYSAPWCSTCKSQNSVIRKVATNFKNIEMVAVITSGTEIMTQPTRADGNSLKAKIGFPEERIVLEEDGYSRTIPQHLLLSSDGSSLFRHEGMLSFEQINKVIDEFIVD